MAKATIKKIDFESFKTYSSKGDVVKSSEPQTAYASTSIQGALCDSAAELETLNHIIDSLTDRLRDISTAADANGDKQPNPLILGDCTLATQVMSIADRLRLANARLTAVLQDLRL